MKTGKILWAIQDTENDAWVAGCGPQNPSENCPKDIGPDYDFGSSPILRTLPNGHRILVAGQKSGMVWGHDPDREGTVVWKAQLVQKLALGMITFGGAADEQNAYFGLRTGGVAAVQLDTGERKWFTPITPGRQLRDSWRNRGHHGDSRRHFFRRMGRSPARIFDQRWPPALGIQHHSRIRYRESRCGKRWIDGCAGTNGCRRHALCGVGIRVWSRHSGECIAGVFSPVKGSKGSPPHF